MTEADDLGQHQRQLLLIQLPSLERRSRALRWQTQAGCVAFEETREDRDGAAAVGVVVVVAALAAAQGESPAGERQPLLLEMAGEREVEAAERHLQLPLQGCYCRPGWVSAA